MLCLFVALSTNTFHKVLNCKFLCKEERKISGGVRVEETTLKGHYAPRFNSMHIEYTD